MNIVTTHVAIEYHSRMCVSVTRSLLWCYRNLTLCSMLVDLMVSTIFYVTC